MNQCFMAAWLAFAIHFELNHVQNRHNANGNMEFKEEKSHAKSIRVAIRPSNIYAFKQKFTFLQLSDFSNLRFKLKSNLLFV